MKVCTLLIPSLVWLWPGLAATAAEPISLGSRLELFVDPYLIESLTQTSLKLHEPVKAPRPQSPLPVQHMMTVIKDGDLFRAWYRGSDSNYKGPFHSGHPGEIIQYAESKDGHEWTFPKLGLHEANGSRDNNVILANMPPFLTNFMPFLDNRPGIPKEERYKALAGYPGPGDKRGTTQPGRGLFAFVSPDGIHWTKKHEAIPYRPEWRHAFDSPNVSFWSEAEQKYVCYFRTWSEPDRLRTISRSTSPDFITWSPPAAMQPNQPGEHLYTSMTHPYFRAPHLYIALPTRYVPGVGEKKGSETTNNVTDVLFMTSRAGTEAFDRTFKEAFIRPGLDPNRWVNRANYVACNVLPTGPQEMSIYHRSGDRYTLRTDGFASVHAGAEEGEFLTKPITFTGRTLILNFSGSAVGQLRVEIQDVHGTPIPGFSLADCEPVTGDQIELPVRWKNGQDLAKLAGQPIRLRFTLRDSDLFSLRFRQ
ncbi:hypothetical protein SAMN02745166_04465 [Prosthecobacter debontii]|uniref:Glycosyl hydrolases family 32 N-terminal domain-containing protein n=1 Tax=Prosthecobacter debontii TaxID=48467 RepID=A0A1T4YX37_9BACT|nr:hypothetical protein [Prosthecobacter debontii]SKB06397.1 hypothetical protein SAMN02745166_04465 [Prosthecobacter debontii]